MNEWPYFDPDDDAIPEPQAPAAVKAPDIDDVMKKLEALETKIRQEDDAPQEAPTAPLQFRDVTDDADQLLDPRQIVDAAATQAMAVTAALDQARKEIRQRTQGELADEEIDTLIDRMKGMPPKQVIEIVNTGGHIMAAYSMVGDKAVQRKATQSAQPTQRPPTGIGPATGKPASASQDDAFVADFERMYGKVTSKRQLERLKEIGRVRGLVN